ncbi:NAD(P)/FAD-dependent oxidoreductase [Phenylobacterium montanum]|uniref:FAD-dependent oxidoreductase n=1 Tax=Phenylobacterium montanum TaxID=2823693 RepID=A0A975G1X9_9CAUL|nr:NAD(P)/FAD-dependent oxidoreductase [Caulobacter sp. S6]QUD89365.1 FAD-dependent oxidoreductase [Caulobacter sp. S6]
MPEAAAAPSDAPSVAVVGAGLAGLTAALNLSRRGFNVTVYESKPTVGGNLSSQTVDGVRHDVYPHMFCDWYSNFWRLFEQDLGLSRAEHFDPRMGVRLLDKDSDQLLALENATTLEAVVNNLKSGVLPPPEMFLLGFSMLDLASHAFHRTKDDQIQRLDVNGFIYSRAYATEGVARLQNYMLSLIWSVQSDETAAASYQDFIKHTLTFPHPTPFCWMLKGSLYDKIIRPLESRLGCEIRRGQTVQMIELVEGKPQLTVTPAVPAKGRRKPTTELVQPDHMVLAVPGPALAGLVMNGAPGRRIVDQLPGLAGLQRFRSVAIPVVDLYFKRKLEGVPKEQIGLAGSDYDLSVLDISQLWTGDPQMEGRTALVLAASNGDALPSLDPQERGFLMIKRLHDFMPLFEPGAHWGDPASDICWEMTHYRSNDEHRLFINDVGSWEWRPQAAYPGQLPNVFFAGDFCQTDVDMATVEAAVESGLLAAQALQAQDAVGRPAPRGEPITLVGHETYGDTTFLAAKLALLPFAYAATAWSALSDNGRHDSAMLPADAYSPSTAVAALPLAFALDWWKTAYWLGRKVVRDIGKLEGAAMTTAGAQAAKPASSDAALQFGSAALNRLGDALQALSEQQPTRGEPRSGSQFASSLSGFTTQLLKTARAAYEAAQTAAQQGAPPDEPHRRRWRAKP